MASMIPRYCTVGFTLFAYPTYARQFERPDERTRTAAFFEHPLIVESSYSFPSGHAMESLVVYGMLAYFAVLALRAWKWRVAAVVATTLLVLLIVLSRMYLGVHYLNDVAAGHAAGACGSAP